MRIIHFLYNLTWLLTILSPIYIVYSIFQYYIATRQEDIAVAKRWLGQVVSTSLCLILLLVILKVWNDFKWPLSMG